jgi:hypothetical protein
MMELDDGMVRGGPLGATFLVLCPPVTQPVSRTFEFLQGLFCEFGNPSSFFFLLFDPYPHQEQPNI